MRLWKSRSSQHNPLKYLVNNKIKKLVQAGPFFLGLLKFFNYQFLLKQFETMIWFGPYSIYFFSIFVPSLTNLKTQSDESFSEAKLYKTLTKKWLKRPSEYRDKYIQKICSDNHAEHKYVQNLYDKRVNWILMVFLKHGIICNFEFDLS